MGKESLVRYAPRAARAHRVSALWREGRSLLRPCSGGSFIKTLRVSRHGRNKLRPSRFLRLRFGTVGGLAREVPAPPRRVASERTWHVPTGGSRSRVTERFRFGTTTSLRNGVWAGAQSTPYAKYPRRLGAWRPNGLGTHQREGRAPARPLHRIVTETWLKCRNDIFQPPSVSGEAGLLPCSAKPASCIPWRWGGLRGGLGVGRGLLPLNTRKRPSGNTEGVRRRDVFRTLRARFRLVILAFKDVT